MTDVTPDLAAAVADADHGDGKAHPTVKLFVRTAIILAVITAVEVAWSYLPIWEDATGTKAIAEVGGLFIMMLAKFVIVAGTFMHLKFDRPMLARLFYAGFILAVSVFIAVLAAFEFFSSGPPGYQP